MCITKINDLPEIWQKIVNNYYIITQEELLKKINYVLNNIFIDSVDKDIFNFVHYQGRNNVPILIIGNKNYRLVLTNEYYDDVEVIHVNKDIINNYKDYLLKQKIKKYI